MSSYMRGVRRLSCMTSIWRFWLHLVVIFTSLCAKRFDVNVQERSRTELFLIEKSSYFSVKFIKHICKSKCNCRRKYARKRIHDGCELLIENSVTRVTVRHHSASLVMPNSYPRDGIFNQHLTTIKDSYNPDRVKIVENLVGYARKLRPICCRCSRGKRSRYNCTIAWLRKKVWREKFSLHKKLSFLGQNSHIWSQSKLS